MISAMSTEITVEIINLVFAFLPGHVGRKEGQ